MSLKMIELNNVVDFLGGFAFKSDNFTETGYPVARISNISNGIINLDEIAHISPDGAKKLDSYLLFSNDILIAMSGATTGKIGIMPAKVVNKILLNQRVGKFIIKDKAVLFFKYLYHYLQSKYFKQQVDKYSAGCAQPNISPKQLKLFKIPLPPLPIQKKIAEVLDKADSLRQKRKEAIAKLDELAQSIFLDMFGDPVTNPKGWEVKRLAELVSFLTSGSRGWAKYYDIKGKLFLRIQNVKNGFLLMNDIQYVNAQKTKEAVRTKVESEDLLITITADLGRTAIVDKATANYGAYINQHIALVRLSKICIPRYISAFLESNGGKLQFQKLDQVGVKSGLNFNAINSLELLFPPYELQKQYAIRIEKIQSLKAQHQKSFTESNNLFNSLMQRAFKGDLSLQSE